MLIKSFGFTDVGKRREKNEDAYLINADLELFTVADGMGGHLGGGFASKLAVETIEEVIRGLEVDPDMTLRDESVAVKPGEFQSYLRYAITLASRRIFDKASNESMLHGMGTTVVVLLYKNNKIYIANVGDSRAYRIRNKKIEQVTKDHSLVGEQIRAGIISEDEAKTHRLKNIITRSVGFQEEVDADVEIRVAREGDIYLQCTDGLTNMLEDSEIRDIIVTNDLEPAARKLVSIANERGGDDNITVVLSEVEKLDAEPSLSDESEEMTIENL